MENVTYFEENKNSFSDRMDNLRKPSVADRPPAVDKKDKKYKHASESGADGNKMTFRRSVRMK